LGKTSQQYEEKTNNEGPIFLDLNLTLN
jgi:hypothetical protein